MRQSEQETLAARAVAADWQAAEDEEAAEQPLDVMALHERLKEVRTGRQRHSSFFLLSSSFLLPSFFLSSSFFPPSFFLLPSFAYLWKTISRQARDKHIGKKQTHTMWRFT